MRRNIYNFLKAKIAPKVVQKIKKSICQQMSYYNYLTLEAITWKKFS